MDSDNSDSVEFCLSSTHFTDDANSACSLDGSPAQYSDRDSDTDLRSASETASHGDSETDSHGDSETDSHRESKTDSNRDSETVSHDDSDSYSNGDSESESHSDNETGSQNDSETYSHNGSISAHSDAESSEYSGNSYDGHSQSSVNSITDDMSRLWSEFLDSLNAPDFEEDSERAMLNARAEYEVTERFRERSWSLEECTVCCDVMLRNQELEMLPCGHQFHACCIRPWLEERTTCPNCRKNA